MDFCWWQTREEKVIYFENVKIGITFLLYLFMNRFSHFPAWRLEISKSSKLLYSCKRRCRRPALIPGATFPGCWGTFVFQFCHNSSKGQRSGLLQNMNLLLIYSLSFGSCTATQTWSESKFLISAMIIGCQLLFHASTEESQFRVMFSFILSFSEPHSFSLFL